MDHNPSVQYSEVSALQTNKVLRSTYLLLSMTLLFSAFCAYLGVQFNMPHLGLVVTLGGFFGLLFLTHKLANSAWGLLAVFAFTGFMGLTLAPMLSFALERFSNGPQMVMMALGGTGIIFLALSGFALTTKKDFSAMGKFLFIGILVAFFAGIAAYVFKIQALSLAVSAAFVLLMSGLILWETQQIARGGETNYIRATVSLYISIYNLFASLLHLLMAFMGED